MALTKALIEAYLDANIILAVSAGVWVLVVATLGRTGFADNFAGQLRLAKTVLTVALVSPALALALSSGASLLAPQQALTLTDMAVARYLEGGVAVDAVTVETVLNMRQSLVLDLVYAHGSWAQIVLITFLLGALLYLGLLVQRALRLSRIVGQSYLWRRHAAADLRLSDHIAVPFSTRGLWRRHVVVPSSMVTDTKRLRMVLAHEFEHIRRGDLEWELVSVLVRPLFFWNPGYWLWARSLERLRELGCDQALL
ncbi:MAG: M56 family metallopeptidase, partial [Pseudomonadota bacterium]